MSIYPIPVSILEEQKKKIHDAAVQTAIKELMERPDWPKDKIPTENDVQVKTPFQIIPLFIC